MNSNTDDKAVKGNKSDSKEKYVINWKDVAQRVRKARESAGFNSATELAREIGISKDDISKIERATGAPEKGKSLITLEKMALIASACNASLDWLMWGKEEYKNQPTFRDYCRSMAEVCEGLGAKVEHQYGINGQEFTAHIPMEADIYCDECITLTIPLCKQVGPFSYASRIDNYLADFTNELEVAVQSKNKRSRRAIIDNALKDVPNVPLSEVEDYIPF